MNHHLAADFVHVRDASMYQTNDATVRSDAKTSAASYNACR